MNEQVTITMFGLSLLVICVAAEASYSASDFKTDYKATDYKPQSYKGTDYKKKDYKTEEGDDDSLYVYPSGFKGGRYYYGGIYRGTCNNDGLYYKDEDSFVICSNGNAYVQPCAPGTRSSGQNRYSPGYYYGYSDFCDINLVDQGYGPAHYAPYGVPTYQSPGYSGQDTAYNTKKATDYSNQESYDYDKQSYGGAYSSYGSSNNVYDNAKDSYGTGNGAGAYASKGYKQQQQFTARDAYDKLDNTYESNSKF